MREISWLPCLLQTQCSPFCRGSPPRLGVLVGVREHSIAHLEQDVKCFGKDSQFVHNCIPSPYEILWNPMVRICYNVKQINIQSTRNASVSHGCVFCMVRSILSKPSAGKNRVLVCPGFSAKYPRPPGAVIIVEWQPPMMALTQREKEKQKRKK